MIFDHLTGRPMTDHEGRLVLNQDAPHFGFTPAPKPEIEFMALAHNFEDIEAVTDAATMMKNALHDGWRIADKTICPPYVMIIFAREKKENTKDVQES